MSQILSQDSSIIKSPSDRRDYLALTLPNDLKILLISDPETDLSSAALSVAIGSMKDPPGRQGLAHLLEHLLFMGSSKYPGENEYTKYLSQHAGSSNASTSLTGANYFFDISPDSLEPALDRFVQFFLSPLFAASSLSRELDSVQSEFLSTLDSDSARLDRIFQILSTQSADYRKFTNGCLESLHLDESLRTELISFYSEFYSSNLMCLCVLGKAKISELKEMIVPKFSQILNKNFPTPRWTSHPFQVGGTIKHVKVVPIMDIQSVTLRFIYPDDLEYYKCDPSGYLAHLFNLTAPGSLLHYLRETTGFASYLSARSFGSNGFGFFEIDIDLTEDGFTHMETVIQSIFEFISFHQISGPQKFIWEEIRALREVKFRFAGKTHPIAYVTHLAYMMQYFPYQSLLSAYNLLDDFNPQLISQCLSYLKPENCSIVSRSHSYRGMSNQIEEFYKIEYKIEEFSKEFTFKLRNVLEEMKFSLPKINKLIPVNFEIFKTDNATVNPRNEKNPILLKTSKILKCWYLKDTLFETPKVFYGITFFNPLVNVTPQADNATNLLIILFKESISDLINEADNAGLSVYISNTSYGIHIELRGYHDKMNLLLVEILEKFITFKSTAECFNQQKEEYSRTLKDFETIPARVLASYYQNLLTCSKIWSIEEKIAHLDQLTLESLTRLQTSLLSTFSLEVLCHGNLTPAHALTLCQLIEQTVIEKLKPVPLGDHFRPRQIMLEPGCSYRYQVNLSTHAQTNAILVYYEIGFDNLKELALLKLIVKLLDESFYDQLRTKQQLGYSVAIGTIISSGVYGLSCSIESKFSCQLLERKIEEFLDKQLKIIHDLLKETFESEKKSLIGKLLEKDKNLAQVSSRMWAAITSGEADFEKKEKVAEIIRNLSHEEVVEFYKTFISENGDKRRKLSVWVTNNENLCQKEADSIELNSTESCLVNKQLQS